MDGDPNSPLITPKVQITRDDGKNVNNTLWNRREKYIWVLTLFTGCSVLYTARTVMPLCVVAISKELKWDKTQSGMVLSCFFWGYTMTQVLGGYLSDRIGGDIVISFAACGWSFITFITPKLAYLSSDKATTVNVIVLSRVLLGACQGFHYPSVTSIVSKKISQKNRSLTYAFVAAGSHCGTLLCGSIGSLLLEYYGWESTFYVIGVGGFLWMLFLRYYLLGGNKPKNQVVSLKNNMVPDSFVPQKEHIPVPWMSLLSRVPFWALVVAHFCENYAFFILLSWLPSYFHENFPQAKGWVFNVLPWLLTIFSAVSSGWIADNLISKGYTVTAVRKVMQSLCFLGTALFLFLLSFMHTFHTSLFCVAVGVMCCGFHNSGVLVNVQDIAPQFAGSVFGLMNMAGAIPGFIGVYVAGHMLEVTKSWTAVFNQTSMVCIFGWAVYVIFGTGKKII
ncbi:solute carrier family 17 member 9 isoform X1 [Lingula anatina]|uniref:Solute carrier family 17 member 9 isoform X1 n=1 Tax=Lingula anatina TaxID=7574 RepID=A0A1S3KH65_LINAN|nr:solute carrier family 17 member 9 isoform X1 [Lingula anatina]|eukprot:XP_013421814.1 solute carrier family 17 member 9 isoform X1 [Lingula anatina]